MKRYSIRSVVVLTTLFLACGLLLYPVQASEDESQESAVTVKVKDQPIDPRAFDYYVDGLVAEGFDDYLEATNNFRKAFQYHPDSYELGMAYARALYRQGDYSKAIAIMERLSPKDPRLLELTAASYRNLGQNTEAKECYLKIVTQDSTATNAYSYLTGWYQQLNNLDSTIWGLENLRRLQPENYRIINDLARAYNLNDQFAKARESYLESINTAPGPENLRAVVSLAGLYEQDHKLDSARWVLSRALDSDSDNVNIQREVVRLYLAEDSISAALPHIKKIATLVPDNRLAQRHVGIVYFTLDSLRQADSVFTTLVDMGDDSSVNLFYLGRIALAREDYRLAVTYLAKLVNIEDTVYDNWSALAFAYRQMNEPDSEISTYRTGLEHMKDEGAEVQMLFALGAAYERTDQVDSSVAAFERILDNHPAHAASLNYLGYTLADRGIRLEYAHNLLSRAVELEPENAAFLDSYGWLYFKMGKLDSAVQYLSEAAALDTDPVIYDHLGDAYHSIGQTDKAREWWQKALEQDPENAAIIEKLKH